MDIKVKEEYLRRAIKLHEKYPVVDAHLDLAGEILLRHQSGEKDVIKNHYMEHFKTAGINLIVSSVYVEDQNLACGWENALAQIGALKKEVQSLDDVELILSKADLEQTVEQNKTGILLYMEGLDCIGQDIDKLNELYDLGVRGAALTWSRPNALAVGCCKATRRIQMPGRITEAGQKAVKRMEELSMFLDVSHLNDEGYEQLLGLAERPFIATHSGSRHVYESYRNMTDEQMAALAGQGGIMGVNGCKFIAGSEKGNHLEMLCRHVEYEAEKIGAEHVGFGFDLCDSYGRARAALKGVEAAEPEDCLLNHGQIPIITAALLQRGMKEQEAVRIIGVNFIDYFKNFLI